LVFPTHRSRDKDRGTVEYILHLATARGALWRRSFSAAGDFAKLQGRQGRIGLSSSGLFTEEIALWNKRKTQSGGWTLRIGGRPWIIIG